MPLTHGKEPPLGGGGVEFSETPCGEPSWLHLDDMRPSLWALLAWRSPQALFGFAYILSFYRRFAQISYEKCLNVPSQVPILPFTS